MSTLELQQTFDALFQNHLDHPSMYFLGEGDSGVCALCKKSLKLLKQFQIKDFYKQTTALPYYPILRIVQNFIIQIEQYYHEHETELILLFLFQLLPSNPLPLRQDVLKSLEFCSAMICLYNDKLQQRPITAHIDGYYDFVAPIAENEMRIHLITPDGKQAALPPSITFFVEDKKNISPQEFIFHDAPQIGSSTQFHAFMATIAQTNPLNDLMYMFEHAICSDDLSFATALCVVDPRPESLPNISKLLNVLTVNGYLDHFLRSLACSVRKVVIGQPPPNHIELTALINIFVVSSLEWSNNVLPSDIKGLIRTICRGLEKNKFVPQLCLYIAKTMLTIAAYEDPCGDAAIAMFMEIIVFPFAKKFSLENEFLPTKTELMSKTHNDPELRDIIEDTIIHILGREIAAPYFPSAVKRVLPVLYKFALKNVDLFVQILLVLNARPVFEHPPVQTMIFSLMKANEIYAYEANSP
ncbi:hypothetical protein TRFO_41431 [Tritrichomonas foetus]|uniref:Uncharacterized protein n=1 Tax=Tritrichomonas foetus TaxID=1144522 RepID=A0A1J4L4Q8_9EUKA|nr:hypothetical protein TRFO_41431 [Tritrichomonas foetus]|eukprot:OHT16964.1 hypothetical protein TRFO_41431 [Tritrichomonas foetus]